MTEWDDFALEPLADELRRTQNAPDAEKMIWGVRARTRGRTRRSGPARASARGGGLSRRRQVRPLAASGARDVLPPLGRRRSLGRALPSAVRDLRRFRRRKSEAQANR